MSVWPIFKGNAEGNAEEHVAPHDGIMSLPPAPRWRRFRGAEVLKWSLDERFKRQDQHSQRRGKTYHARDIVVEQVNAALFLRRPLLVTGNPGTGKSSLAHAVAYQLKLGSVLEWPINSRSTLQDALYRYDAIARLQEVSLLEKMDDESVKLPDIGLFLRLGPLGTALVGSQYPRVLLIDEIDKSDIDLPNDLLTVFEEGWFEIPELARLAKQSRHRKATVLMHDSGQNQRSLSVPVYDGRVQCQAFPFIVITSNGERVLPPAFLRRCIQLRIPEPEPQELRKIVERHFDPEEPDDEMANYEGAVTLPEVETVLSTLLEKYKLSNKGGMVATDQLLNAFYLALMGVDIVDNDKLLKIVFEHLGGSIQR